MKDATLYDALTSHGYVRCEQEHTGIVDYATTALGLNQKICKTHPASHAQKPARGAP